jgi:hypothetical protein
MIVDMLEGLELDVVGRRYCGGDAQCIYPSESGGVGREHSWHFIRRRLQCTSALQCSGEGIKASRVE